MDDLVTLYLSMTGVLYLAGLAWKGTGVKGCLLHALGIAFIFSIRWAHSRVGGIVGILFRLIHDWYPPVILPFLYVELARLNRIVWESYFDSWIQSLERWVFTVSPVLWFSEVLPSLLVSEYLHFAYIFYYLMIPILGFALYLKKRSIEFQAYIWTLMMTFFFCYIWFIFFPVEGPRYSSPLLAETLQRGIFYRFSHWVLDQGAARGAAFPSSHVAAAMVTLFCAWKWERKVFLFLLPLGVGLTLGTVYGRFHYGVDALAGIFVAAMFYYIGPATYSAWSKRRCVYPRISDKTVLRPLINPASDEGEG